jgi:hypothetical protein
MVIVRGTTLNQKNPFDKDAVLWEGVDAALSGLGDPVKKTVIWHLNSKGQYIGRKGCSARELYSTLEELIGSGVDVIFNEVCTCLEKRLINPDLLLGFKRDSYTNSPIDKIERLLGMGEKDK